MAAKSLVQVHRRWGGCLVDGGECRSVAVSEAVGAGSVGDGDRDGLDDRGAVRDRLTDGDDGSVVDNGGSSDGLDDGGGGVVGERGNRGGVGEGSVDDGGGGHSVSAVVHLVDPVPEGCGRRYTGDEDNRTND